MNKIEKEKLKKYQQQIYGNPNWINGRINRAEYFCRGILLALGSGLMMAGVGFGLAKVAFKQSLFGWGIVIVCGLLLSWLIWQILMTYVKRLHDLGWTGWLVIPFVFPEIFNHFLKIDALSNIFSLLMFILSLLLLFKRGTKGVNKYGKDPLTKYEENE